MRLVVSRESTGIPDPDRVRLVQTRITKQEYDELTTRAATDGRTIAGQLRRDIRLANDRVGEAKAVRP